MSEFTEAADKAITASDWDPGDNKRTYYRSAIDGQLGWLVRRGGRQMIRLDRGATEILRQFNEGQWVPDKEHRPINRAQVARICFAADRELCIALGMHAEGKREWIDLSQDEKRTWMQEGPESPRVREVMFKRIADALEYLVS
mgnify:CR=1 FL=1